MDNKELNKLKAVLPVEMEVIEVENGRGEKQHVLKWKNSYGKFEYIDLFDFPAEVAFRVIISRAIELGKTEGATWAANQIKEVLKYASS